MKNKLDFQFLGLLFVFALLFVVFESFVHTKNHCEPTKKKSFTYQVNKPNSVQILPEILMEISGLTDLDESNIACVQDEKGIIFIYNFLSKKIEQEFTFGADLDYEGLTRVGETFYALTSDGTLYETNLSSSSIKTNLFKLNLPSWDNEGLGYDEKNHQLLIAPKSKLGKGSEYKDLRGIFSFDLKTKKLNDTPLFYFKVSELVDFAKKNNIQLITQEKPKGGFKEFNFRPASVAVHPTTDDIYVLSAEDFCLAIFKRTGEIQNLIMLDSKVHTKPEGITFLTNGTMIISNEGIEKNPTLLIFEPIR